MHAIPISIAPFAPPLALLALLTLSTYAPLAYLHHAPATSTRTHNVQLPNTTHPSDAGSSGTRVYVYRWPRRVFHTLPPQLTEVARPLVNQKYKPGIGACDAAVPKGAAALAACVAGPLTKLLAFAETTILSEAGGGSVNVSSVPVYLGATAGLRLLVPEHSAAIMGAVRTCSGGLGVELVAGREGRAFSSGFEVDATESGTGSWGGRRT